MSCQQYTYHPVLPVRPVAIHVVARSTAASRIHTNLIIPVLLVRPVLQVEPAETGSL